MAKRACFPPIPLPPLSFYLCTFPSHCAHFAQLVRILSIIRYVAAFSSAAFFRYACSLSPSLSLCPALSSSPPHSAGFSFHFHFDFPALSIRNSTLNFCFVFISCGRGESPKTRIIFHFLPHRLCVYVHVYMCAYSRVCVCVCSSCCAGPAPHSAFNVRNLLVFSSSSFSLMWFFRLNQFYYCLFILYISLFSFYTPYAYMRYTRHGVCVRVCVVLLIFCWPTVAAVLIGSCGWSCSPQPGAQLTRADYTHTHTHNAMHAYVTIAR